VPCSLGHELYTFGVASVGSDAHSWKSSAGQVDAEVERLAEGACDTKLADLLPDVTPGARLSEFLFFPPVTAWTAGARWVRCDLGVERAGSLVATPQLAKLPPDISTLVKQAAQTPDLFDDCITTTDPSGDTGPYDDPLATVADCSRDHQWNYQGYFRIPEDPDAPYPTSDQIHSFLQQQCGNAAEAEGRRWVGYLPTPDQWASGERFGECWVTGAA